MEINIRWISKDYVDVNITDFGNRLDIGVLNEKERKELALQFEEAIDELSGE